MKDAKKVLVLFIVAVLLLLSLSMSVFADDVERIIVYAKVPEDWTEPCVWAWADDGTNAFKAWPGGEMEADENNPGWYYCWIPAETGNVIINANEGEVQTADFKLEAKNAWLIITDADTVEISYETKTTGEIPEYVEKFPVHAKVDENWEDVCIWAWLHPDGTNAYEAWPGKTMKAKDTGWYTVNVPIWVNSIIINANGGEVQTEDLTIDPAEVWVTVDAEGVAEFTYNDPDAPVVDDITVYVKSPADWNEPHLWAWSAPDGTNVFSSWPGEALQDAGDGWLLLEVPGWVNSVIVNGNEGSVQTADLSVDAGKDLWVVVTDAENVAVYYEKPEIPKEPEPTETEPPAETSAPEVTSEPAKEEPEKGGINPLLIAIPAVAAIAGAGVYFSKKKKS
ncbi:MAG: starch-binding protein [Clostridiaceae bacterium]|jgi:hypothetical protein|nr:starch-binding protein [Clostridiaceae bacterium]